MHNLIDLIFSEMARLGYTDVRYSFFKRHVKGTLEDGTVHYYRVVDGDYLELMDEDELDNS